MHAGLGFILKFSTDKDGRGCLCPNCMCLWLKIRNKDFYLPVVITFCFNLLSRLLLSCNNNIIVLSGFHHVIVINICSVERSPPWYIYILLSILVCKLWILNSERLSNRSTDNLQHNCIKFKYFRLITNKHTSTPKKYFKVLFKIHVIQKKTS